MTDLEYKAVMQALAESQPGWLIEQRNVPQTITERRTYHGPGVIDTGKGGVLIDPPIPRPVDEDRSAERGEDGEPGEDGETPTIDATVTDGTLDVAVDDTAAPHYVFNFSIPIPEDGVDGKQVEIGIDSESIAWRYTTPPDEPWTPLVLLEDLKGDPGDPATLPSGTDGDFMVLERVAGEWVQTPGYREESVWICPAGGGAPSEYKILARPA